MDFLVQARQVATKALEGHTSVYKDELDRETAWLVEADGELSRTNGVDPNLPGLQAFVGCGEGIYQHASNAEMEDPEFIEKASRMAEASKVEYAGVRNPYLFKRLFVVICRTGEGQVLKSVTGVWDQTDKAPSDGRSILTLMNGSIILIEIAFQESEVRG